ncbi:hypothetical protein [Ancylobacter oerskovii]|uniref:Uncharacterized protein n=1 Tax=Ancylobacter oerskovii TaxID=459519 RepID=A0ABW4Z1C2_9HYPH|nr:hypothetical protein [Ancylobacter oerskovii]MBS7545072.1 hypothetical protein [Ancylobacter oerskovii]
MAFYVEVMCNERKQWPDGTQHMRLRCFSDENANPQGIDLRSASAEARRTGWAVFGRYACCPGCRAALSQPAKEGE